MEFQLNSNAMNRLATSPGVANAVFRVAQIFQRNAEGLAPVETGKYKASFGITTQVEQVGGKPRATARVVNNDPRAAAIEFGNIRRRPEAVLGRSMHL